jgi:hypothetical protein
MNSQSLRTVITMSILAIRAKGDKVCVRGFKLIASGSKHSFS